uniref:Uncharacterized protein n=1 Tax=Anguilla anguilla TaxID=7936 RepID=A0A0E9RBI6_ANGAN
MTELHAVTRRIVKNVEVSNTEL